MTDFLLNELDYVNSLWENESYPENIYPYTLVRLFTNLFYCLGFDVDHTKEFIFSKFNNYHLSATFYEEYIANNVIDRCYNNLLKGKVQKLKELEYIPIYQSDIDKIDMCESLRQKKFLFTLIVLARYTDKHGWVYQSDSDIYKLANISRESKNKSNIIFELKNMNLIKTTKRVDDTKIGIDLENVGEIVLRINNLKHLGNQYVEYSNSNKKCCENCGRLITIKSKTKKPRYCKSCASRINTDKTNANNKERRKSLII